MTQTWPILQNILDLADDATWAHALEVSAETAAVWLKGVRAEEVRRIYLTGCGTSCYAGEVGRNILEQIAHVPSQAMHAFNLGQYLEPAILGPEVLVIGISTSGSTEAVAKALAHARRYGARTLALTAEKGGAVAEAAEAVVLTGGEADRTPVKTKSYVQTLLSLFEVAMALAEARGLEARRAYWRSEMDKAAEGTRRFLEAQREEVQALVEAYGGAQIVFILASGPNLGTAQEAALKVIEMAKMYCEWAELEDFLHGRYREVDQANPMILIAPQGRSSAHVLDVLTVNRYVGAPSVVFTDVVSEGIGELATQVVQMPVSLDELATPLLYITPLHLFAHQMAIRRGWDPLSRRYDDIVPHRVRYGNLAAGLVGGQRL